MFFKDFRLILFYAIFHIHFAKFCVWIIARLPAQFMNYKHTFLLYSMCSPLSHKISRIEEKIKTFTHEPLRSTWMYVLIDEWILKESICHTMHFKRILEQTLFCSRLLWITYYTLLSISTVHMWIAPHRPNSIFVFNARIDQWTELLSIAN